MTELCHLLISPCVVMFASVQYCVSPDVGLCESSVLAYFLYLAACYTFSPYGVYFTNCAPVRVISNKIEHWASLYHNFVEKESAQFHISSMKNLQYGQFLGINKKEM